jgi:predicted RND superfamily exporter protein
MSPRRGPEAWAASWGRRCAERPRSAALILLLITVLLAVPAGLRLRARGMPLDFTPQALFIDAGPAVAQLRAAEVHFGREDNDLVAIAEGPIESEAGAAWLAAVHAALEADPDVERVDSPINAELLVDRDGQLVLERPMALLPPPQALAALAADPSARRLLVSERGDVAALRVRIDRRISRIAELSPVVERLSAAARAAPPPPGCRLSLTGVPYVRAEVVERMMTDQQRFMPMVAVAFAGAIVLMFRRFWLGLSPLFAVLVADLWAMSALVASGATFNILSVLVPTLVVVIGAADGIHVTARFRELRAEGQGRAEALAGACADMLLACWLTTFTTAAGFASLLVADTRVIREFGLQASVAMVVCFFGVMMVLPLFLAMVPDDRVVAAPRRSDGRLLAALSDLTARRPGFAIGLCAGLSMIALAVGSGVRTNSRLLEMYGEDTDTYRAVHLSQDHLSGVIPIFFYLEGPPGALLEPGALARQRALQAALAAEPAVRWTASAASALDSLHGALTGAAGGPDSREAAAQELLLAELSGAAPLRGLIDETQGRGRVLALVRDDGGRGMLATRARLEEVAAALYAGAPETAVLTGDGLLAAIGVDGLISDLLSGIALVFVVISLTLLLILRDPKLVLLATVPNLVPLLFTLATLGLIGADLQTSNIVSFTVAVGLAVDDTIHFLVRFNAERKAGSTVPDAIHKTILGAGDAIIATSVLLVAGFGLLTFSEVTSTRHFGLLSSVTMVAALAGDLVLLPAMLHVQARWSRG